MESLKRAVRFLITDSRKSIIVFWVVMLIIDTLLYLNLYAPTSISIEMSIQKDNITLISMAGTNFMAIVIYLIVYSRSMYYENFSLGISFSVTRKDFFTALIINNVFICFVFSVIQGILMKLDSIIITAIGKNPISNFAIFNTSTDNIFYIIASLFIVSLVVTTIFSFLASMNYKFGYAFWMLVGAIFFITLFTIKGQLMGKKAFGYILYNIISPRLDFLKVIKTIIFITIFYTFGYVLTINSDIKQKSK